MCVITFLFFHLPWIAKKIPPGRSVPWSEHREEGWLGVDDGAGNRQQITGKSWENGLWTENNIWMLEIEMPLLLLCYGLANLLFPFLKYQIVNWPLVSYLKARKVSSCRETVTQCFQLNFLRNTIPTGCSAIKQCWGRISVGNVTAFRPSWKVAH